MDQRTRLSYQLMIFLSIYFMCTSIIMIFYFIGQSDDISGDTLDFLLFLCWISIIIFFFLAIYSYYGLKGKSSKIVENAVVLGFILSVELGYGVIILAFPFFILMDIEGLGYYQRLTIMLLFLSFWIVLLFFILKITHYKKSKRKGR